MQLRPRVPASPRLRWPIAIRYASTGAPKRINLKGSTKKVKKSTNTGAGDHQWEPNRLRTTSKYPLTLELSKSPDKVARAYFPADVLYVRGVAQYARTQIVSPELCDDVLKYIGPTLEKYKGCDILDLNPGVGLWSRKLHEFLKPRSHLLVDSSPETWDPWLKPLLEAPDSTYKIVQGDITKHETFARMVEEGMFPHQKRVYPGDPDCQRPNESLLVTGTLLWDPRLPGFGFDSMTKQMLFNHAESAWKNAGIHAFGPVRSLFWTGHDVQTIIPKSQNHRAKYDFYLDILSKNTLVVTEEHKTRSAGRTSLGREPQHEIESLIGALKRGRENGFELPAHRRENVHDFADDVAKMTNGTGLMSASDMQQYLEEQEYAGKSTIGLSVATFIDRIKAEKAVKENPDLYKVMRLGQPGCQWQWTEAGQELKKLRMSVHATFNQKIRCEKAADLGEAIHSLECRILGLGEGEEKEAELAKLKTLEDEFETALGAVNKNYKTGVLSDVDDRIAMRSPVPRLAWDSRPFEPLVSKAEEAWPPMPVSLIDSTPRPLGPGKTPASFDWLQDFASALAQIPQQSVIPALENMQGGAAELISKAPSLTDPAKGGRMNMHQMRVRMLTPEMVEELCQAYKEWPFRNPDADFTRYFRLKGGKGTEK